MSSFGGFSRSDDTLRNRLMELMDVESTMTREEKGQIANNLCYIIRKQYNEAAIASEQPRFSLVLVRDPKTAQYYMLFDYFGKLIQGHMSIKRAEALKGLRDMIEGLLLNF